MEKHWDHSYKVQITSEATQLVCMHRFMTCACALETNTHNHKNIIVKMCATRHVVGAITAKLDTSTKEFIAWTTEGIPLATDMDNSELEHLEEQKRQLLEEIISHLRNKDGISPHILQVFLHLVSLKRSTNVLRAYLAAYSSPYEQ